MSCAFMLVRGMPPFCAFGCCDGAGGLPRTDAGKIRGCAGQWPGAATVPGQSSDAMTGLAASCAWKTCWPRRAERAEREQAAACFCVAGFAPDGVRLVALLTQAQLTRSLLGAAGRGGGCRSRGLRLKPCSTERVPSDSRRWPSPVGVPPARMLLVGWWRTDAGSASPGNFFPTPMSEGAKCVPCAAGCHGMRRSPARRTGRGPRPVARLRPRRRGSAVAGAGAAAVCWDLRQSARGAGSGAAEAAFATVCLVNTVLRRAAAFRQRPRISATMRSSSSVGRCGDGLAFRLPSSLRSVL